MITYNCKKYNQKEYLQLCKHNGIYYSYSEYINNHQDFSIPVVVYIKQSDIDVNPLYHYLTGNTDYSGTLQLVNPSYYIVAEDLTFDYNPSNLYMPTKLQTTLQIDNNLKKRKYNQKYLYPTSEIDGPFDFGFFAGLTVEGNNIVLTSSFKKLQMSSEMHLIQRFFALVCLGSQPFIPRKGPIPSSIKAKFPENVIISDIKFGLTSHHSILGNETKHLNVHKCCFEDFETAAFSLNNADCTTIKHNSIKKNLTTVPVNSNFFSFVMQTRIFNILKMEYDDPLLKTNADYFSLTLNQILKEFQLTKKVSNKEFKNETNGLTDAIAMGIFISQKGPSINETGICSETPLPNPSDRTENIVISYNTVSNIVASPQQTAAVVYNDKPVVLSNGKLFYISRKAHTQKRFLEFVSQLSERQWLNYKPYFAPTTLTPEIAKKLLKDPYQFTPYCNADIMNHLLKPVFGMRIQYTDNLKMENNCVFNVKNCSQKHYCPPKGVKHPKSECINGNDSVGILLSKTSSYLQNNHIKNIYSRCGKSTIFMNG